MMVERGLEKTGPSDRAAMHRVACASEAINEKLRQEIAVFALAARVTVVAMGDGYDWGDQGDWELCDSRYCDPDSDRDGDECY